MYLTVSVHHVAGITLVPMVISRQASIMIGAPCLTLAQWQSNGGSSQGCPGFDFWQLAAFSLSSIFTSWHLLNVMVIG